MDGAGADELNDNGHAEEHDADEVQLSPLHAAVEADDLARVQALVDAGANIEEREEGTGNKNSRQTPLFRAAEKGNVAMARYLVERGADKEASDSNGWTPLLAATAGGHIDVVRMLTEHGANKEGVGHLSPLSLASARGYVALAEYLLEQGCDVDKANDTRGWTALHWAALNNRLEIVQLLMRFGANLDVRTRGGQTAADLATQYGHHDIANAIRAEEIRRRDHGFKRDPSTIEGTEEHAASKRPRAEREAEEAAAAALAAAAAVDESDDDDDDDDDDDEDEEGKEEGR